MGDKNHTNLPCPFLGLLDDADTSQGFPSIWNHCHHSQPIAPPVLAHQEEFCLRGRHRECPVFLSQQAAPLPADLRAPFTPADIKRAQIRQNLIIGFTVFGVVLLLGWGILSQGIFNIPGIEEATQTSFPTISSTPTVVPQPIIEISPLPEITETLFPTLTFPPPSTPSTPTSYITLTPTATPSQLDTVIGTDHKFVIHKVLEGEKLDQYAKKYNTSVQTILAVNHGIKVPVWVNTLVIIPVGFTDFAELPSFVVYQVTQQDRGISVEDMAKRLRVDPADLKYYNGWTDSGDRPLVGQLLLVPRYDHFSK